MASVASVINCESSMELKEIIDGYPVELLLKIFEFLDSKSIRNLTLVNKRWYGIVTDATSTIKKLPLVIRADISRENLLIVENRKFYKVIFKSLNMNSNNCPIIIPIGSTIRKIKFVDCSDIKLVFLQNILSNFPQVEKMSFYDRNLENRIQRSNRYNLELKNLKELVLEQNCLKVLSCFRAQLKSLKVNITSKNHAQSINEYQLMRFLYTQKRLETLELTTINEASIVFAKHENAKYKFKLKVLSLINNYKDKKSEENDLKDFLNTQKDSVEVLTLGSRFSNDVYELILNNFEHVKTLRIDVSDYPTDLSFYRRIKVNTNVTTLIIDRVLEQYRSIFSIFPNVTDICFTSEIPCEVLFWLSPCCSAITSLSIDSFSPGNYQNIKFPALKHFRLENLFDKTELNEFVISNQTIESLSFGYAKKNTFNPEKFSMVCELLPNLKHLKLGFNMNAKVLYFRDLVDVCKNLESLEVFGDQIDDDMMPIREGFKLYCRDPYYFK